MRRRRIEDYSRMDASYGIWVSIREGWTRVGRKAPWPLQARSVVGGRGSCHTYVRPTQAATQGSQGQGRGQWRRSIAPLPAALFPTRSSGCGSPCREARGEQGGVRIERGYQRHPSPAGSSFSSFCTDAGMVRGSRPGGPTRHRGGEVQYHRSTVRYSPARYYAVAVPYCTVPARGQRGASARREEAWQA